MGLRQDLSLEGNDFTNVATAFFVAYVITEIPNSNNFNLFPSTLSYNNSSLYVATNPTCEMVWHKHHPLGPHNYLLRRCNFISYPSNSTHLSRSFRSHFAPICQYDHISVVHQIWSRTALCSLESWNWRSYDTWGPHIVWISAHD